LTLQSSNLVAQRLHVRGDLFVFLFVVVLFLAEQIHTESLLAVRSGYIPTILAA
jgi:hypothetical protein